MSVLLLAGLLSAVTLTPAARAERLALAARAHAKDPTALAEAREALALTHEFDPTAYIKAGKKGEVVEDEYRAALAEYRRHRARLYEAVGACLDARGQARAAVRYLQRALVLDPPGADLGALGFALVHDNRPQEALDVLLSRASGLLAGDRLAAAQEAADLAGIPSLQAELDRVRLGRLELLPRPEPRDGPVRFAERLRLSTGAPLNLEDGVVSVVYVAPGSCRTCSQDLAELSRVVPADVRALVAPADPEDDRTLRQALELYRVKWPVVLGARAGAYGPKAPVVWVIGRAGLSAAVVSPPFARAIPAVLEIFARDEVSEGRPRAKWNGRSAERRKLVDPPALPAEGLIPGEDDPAPPEFTAAETAFRAGRAGEAEAAIAALAARGDGWLLGPEAALDRALCLAKRGDVASARRLLRTIGDSRVQERVDRALESLP
jgi:hypothetical protein